MDFIRQGTAVDAAELHTSRRDVEKCAAIANEQRKETLTDLRTCLFFEQRRWRHFGDHPDPEAMAYITSIVEQIRARLSTARSEGD